jgi:predicted nucleic acid-binding protein
MLPEPSDIWRRVGDARFALARTGEQAAVTHLWIAIVAAESGHTLLTRDRDFERLRRVVPIDLVHF